MVQHAVEDSPLECCGLLAGRDGIVSARYPLQNTLASPTAYSADVGDLFCAFKRLRTECLELLAIYHSHPDSEPIASRRDLEEWHYHDCMMLIIGLKKAHPVCRGWWIEGGLVVRGDIHDV